MSASTPRGTGRRIPVESTFNLRDVGGYPVGGDAVVARGRLFRSDLPGPASDRLGELTALGLRTIVDLRSDGEREKRPSVAASLPGVTAVHGHVGVGLLVIEEPALRVSLPVLYEAALRRLGPEIGRAVSALAGPDALPALVHCTAGKDRTGLVVALVLSALGVSDELVAADYAVTQDLLTPEFFATIDLSTHVPDGQADVTALHGADASAMLASLAAVRDMAGSAREYLLRHGVGAEDLARLERQLVVPRDDTSPSKDEHA
ncbi:hypothetical protein ASD11_00550 [Aeromicrobium sp. Root495]|uniref:tyrosine-protein phosphatase n=1 Tax=Aeromicrobium sp. Root495 TaxID=1736550 RepID=UPI0006FE40E2|nr:tyrosine-protein phosphatase [Aeromicrobium sp. Root495]KQY58194.1 hypothetical protein ASD11_00550 [Aeromicrobium sp. Root495]